MRLTNDLVKALDYEGERTPSGGHSAHFVWDEIPGFGVRVYPSGRKAFLIRYRNIYGKQRYHTIGAFPEVSASAARKEAERIRALVREGGDPKHEADSLRQTFSVKELGEEYIAKYSKPKKKTWETDDGRLKRHVYPRFGRLAAPELNRPMLAKMHREIAEGVGLKRGGGEVEANRALQLVRAIWTWAIRNELLPPGTTNPARHIKKFPEKSRKRWIRPYEMPWVLDAIDQAQNPFSRAALYFILHTGARKSEALELAWSDVDFTGKSVTFRDTKNGTDHLVPLSKPALALLEDLPRVRGNPFVFVGNVDGQHLTDIRKSWYGVRDRASELASAAEPEPVEIDISDVTIHDLRRTVAAWLATTGYSELLIGRVLNHTTQSVTGIYAQIGEDAVRRALEELGRRLENCRQDSEGKVVSIRDGRAVSGE